MGERLDDLLTDLPIEPMADDLPRRVHRALAHLRRAERRRRRALDLALAAALCLGVWFAWPAFADLRGRLPTTAMPAMWEWAQTALTSPAESVLTAVNGGANWLSDLAQAAGLAGSIGLTVLAASLFMIVRRLIPTSGEGAAT